MDIPEQSLSNFLEIFSGFIGGLLGGLFSSIFYLRFIKAREVRIERIEETKNDHLLKIKLQVLSPLLQLFRNKREILSYQYENLPHINEMNNILFDDLHNHFPDLVKNIRHLLSEGQLLCSLMQDFNAAAISFCEGIPQNELGNMSKNEIRQNISRINPLLNTWNEISMLGPFHDEFAKLCSKIMGSPQIKKLIPEMENRRDEYEKIRQMIIRTIEMIFETPKLPGKCEFIEL
jgi:hypothetical protein